MTWVEMVGIAAAIMTVGIYLPQMVRAWRLRDDVRALAGLSLYSIGASIIEFALWIVYCLAEDAPWGAYPYFFVLPMALVTLFLVFRARLKTDS